MRRHLTVQDDARGSSGRGAHVGVGEDAVLSSDATVVCSPGGELTGETSALLTSSFAAHATQTSHDALDAGNVAGAGARLA